MAVKERTPLDSVRELVAEWLRALAELLAPNREDPSEVLDRAPADDEPLTPEDARAIDEGWQQYQEGETTTLDEVKRELG